MLTQADQPTDNAPFFLPECPTPEVPKAASSLENLQRVEIWGIPLASVTYGQTLDLVDRLIEIRDPSFFITANLHYAMLSARYEQLREVNHRAAFIVADGMPMVWYSRLIRRPLPQRVAGADPDLHARPPGRPTRTFDLSSRRWSRRGPANRRHPHHCLSGLKDRRHRVAHADPDDRTRARPPDLANPHRPARPALRRLRAAPRANSGWPKTTVPWECPPAYNSAPPSTSSPAAFAEPPRWAQRIGAEWLYRISRQPKRLIPRYSADALFLAKSVAIDAARKLRLLNRH